MSERRAQEGPSRPGYETADAKPRALVGAGVGLALLCALTLVAMALVLRALMAAGEEELGERHRLAGPPEERELPPAPRLQTSPVEELRSHRAREEERLTTYGWIDRPAGIVRVPVERAMELWLERRASGEGGGR